MRIREAEPRDARAIAEVHVGSWRAAYRGQLTDDYLDDLKVDDRLDQHRRTLEEPRAGWRTWVAEEGGRVRRDRPGWEEIPSSAPADQPLPRR